MHDQLMREVLKAEALTGPRHESACSRLTRHVTENTFNRLQRLDPFGAHERALNVADEFLRLPLGVRRTLEEFNKPHVRRVLDDTARTRRLLDYFPEEENTDGEEEEDGDD